MTKKDDVIVSLFAIGGIAGVIALWMYLNPKEEGIPDGEGMFHIDLPLEQQYDFTQNGAVRIDGVQYSAYEALGGIFLSTGTHQLSLLAFNYMTEEWVAVLSSPLQILPSTTTIMHLDVPDYSFSYEVWQ